MTAAPNLDAQVRALGGKAAVLYAWDPVNNRFQALTADANGFLSIGGLNLSGDVNVDAKALANAAAPALSEGSLNPLSADLLGNLRMKDAAAGTALGSILAKLTADPATQTTLAAILAALGLNHSDETQLHADIATTLHADLGSILAKLSSDPATQTTLAAILTTLGSAATAAKQDVTHTDLVNLLTQTVLAASSAIIGATKDAGPNWTTVWGVTGAPVASADASAGVMVTDVPTSGQKIVADDLILSNRGLSALDFTLKCETTGAIIFGPVSLAGNSTQQFTPRGKGWKTATADKKIQLFTSATGNVSAMIGYHSEA